jgi:hypothetical protein
MDRCVTTLLFKQIVTNLDYAYPSYAQFLLDPSWCTSPLLKIYSFLPYLRIGIGSLIFLGNFTGVLVRYSKFTHSCHMLGVTPTLPKFIGPNILGF